MGCHCHNSTYLFFSPTQILTLIVNLLYDVPDLTLRKYFKAVYLVGQDFSDDVKLTVSYHT